jgi:hypothetical protein
MAFQTEFVKIMADTIGRELSTHSTRPPGLRLPKGVDGVAKGIIIVENKQGRIL